MPDRLPRWDRVRRTEAECWARAFEVAARNHLAKCLREQALAEDGPSA